MAASYDQRPVHDVTSFITVAGPLVRELGLAEWHGGLIITLAGVCWMLLSRAWGLIASYAVCAAGLGVFFPACQALAANSVTAEEQGVAAGALSAAQGVAMVAAPLAGTALYGIFPELPYIMTAAALVLMSGIARLRTPGTEAARQAAIRR